MVSSKVSIIFLVTALIMGPLFFSDEANGTLSIDNGSLVQAENSTAIADIFQSLVNSTLGLIPKTIEIIINILLAPLRALGTIFDSWGGSLAGTGVFSPVVAVFVIILIFVLIRIYSAFDEVGDKAQDLLSPGDE